METCLVFRMTLRYPVAMSNCGQTYTLSLSRRVVVPRPLVQNDRLSVTHYAGQHIRRTRFRS
jgi:hypothetical protein